MTKQAPAAAIVPRMIGSEGDVILNALSFARSHLGMEVAYLAQIVGDDLLFEAVVAPGLEGLIDVGQLLRLDDTLCCHIIQGQLPQLISDTEVFPLIRDLVVMKSFKFRSHVSIPIHRLDGSVYGVFCCIDRAPRPTLNDRDLEVMRAFASLSADQINVRLTLEAAEAAKRDAIKDVLKEEAFEIALQPILHLQDLRTAGYEALCRFSPKPYRPPNIWFEDAAEVGLQTALELLVIKAALTILPDLPEGCYLAINASPETLASGMVAPLIESTQGERIVLEITEHTAIDDLDQLLMAIDRLRELGAQIAVDDAGAGYSGLQQIVRLRPDVIKLDISLTQDVDKDLARRSVASAMVQFATDTNARVVAEGIETEAELRTLCQLGVEMGQGYHLGRPALAADVLHLAKQLKTDPDHGAAPRKKGAPCGTPFQSRKSRLA